MSPSGQHGVVVVGSVNRDVVVIVDHLPGAGETVAGGILTERLGGKGANQAVAAARAGASVALLATVGDDPAGEWLRAELDRLGATTGLVATAPGPSGTALVTVDGRGENQIVVVSGANAATTTDRIDALASLLGPATVVVVQGEVPVATIEATVRAGRTAGATVVLNMAPHLSLPAGLLEGCVVVVNEVEAGQLLGTAAPRSVASARDAAAALAVVSAVGIVSLGAAGAVWATVLDGSHHVPAPLVEAVRDTTGAGDALVGVLAASLATGRSPAEALADAVTAASASVAHPGAAGGYPPFALGPTS